jgi:hypothetical protein
MKDVVMVGVGTSDSETSLTALANAEKQMA